MTPEPPRRAQQLLWRALGPNGETRAILGDLAEDFAHLAEARGLGVARIFYWREAILLSLSLRAQRDLDNLSDRSTLEPLMINAFSLPAIAGDARFALRGLSKELRLSLFAMLIIGLGIGATTAVYSVMSPLMLRPLPFDEPERLAWIANDGEQGLSGVTSRTSNLRDFRALSESFESLTGFFAFFNQRSYNLIGQGEPEKLVGVGVAQNFLDVLRVKPLVGRNFVDEEGVWDGRPAVILSHFFWQRRFAGDRGIVGSAITLDRTAYEVVGVLPASFDFSALFAPSSRVDFLVPFPISDETDRWGNTLSMIGRLQPGVTLAGAQADLERVIAGLKQDDPDRWGLAAVVTGLQQQVSGPYRSAMWLLAAAAGAVMLIVCVNLSNLLLSKGPKRSKEMAVRAALGAPRVRLLRQLLFESLALALGGAVFGVALAVAITRAVAAAQAISIPLLRTVTVDAGALAFSAGVALITGVVIGIVPALKTADGNVAAAFGGSSRGASSSRASTRLREALVIAEVALACVLLVLGGLLLKSFQRVLDVELGFQPRELVTWKLNSARAFEELAEVNAHYDEILRSISSVPGVEAAGLTDAVPLGTNRNWSLPKPGAEEDPSQSVNVYPHLIDRGYIQTMQIPLIAGRHFNALDHDEHEPVAIINESAARALFDGGEAVGRTVRLGDNEVAVVGVVADVRHLSLEADSGSELYLPISQFWDFSSLELVVRSSLPPEVLAPSVGIAIQRVDPTMPVGEYQALTRVVDRSTSPRRFTLMLLTAFASVALLLAALGIYGVLSYSVAERTREIGIRMALGESAGGVLRRVIAKTLALAGIGVALGAGASFAVSRSVSSLLYGVEPTDPLTFLSMAAVLLLVAALAGFLPALRASRTQTVIALQAT
ncbi:MAG: ADOP family duplicated permease [Acidobacteriota bacterium]